MNGNGGVVEIFFLGINPSFAGLKPLGFHYIKDGALKGEIRKLAQEKWEEKWRRFSFLSIGINPSFAGLKPLGFHCIRQNENRPHFCDIRKKNYTKIIAIAKKQFSINLKNRINTLINFSGLHLFIMGNNIKIWGPGFPVKLGMTLSAREIIYFRGR